MTTNPTEPNPANDREHTKLEAEIAERARAIDPEAFSTYWEYGSIMDPYNTGYDGEDGEDCVGRVWWVYDNAGPAVTAWDFLRAHPEVDWDDIYAHQDESSASSEPPVGPPPDPVLLDAPSPEPMTVILPAELVGYARHDDDGWLTIGTPDADGNGVVRIHLHKAGRPGWWNDGMVDVYVRRSSGDLAVFEIAIARHDGLAQEALDEENRWL